MPIPRQRSACATWRLNDTYTSPPAASAAAAAAAHTDGRWAGIKVYITAEKQKRSKWQKSGSSSWPGLLKRRSWNTSDRHFRLNWHSCMPPLIFLTTTTALKAKPLPKKRKKKNKDLLLFKSIFELNELLESNPQLRWIHLCKQELLTAVYLLYSRLELDEREEQQELMLFHSSWDVMW